MTPLLDKWYPGHRSGDPTRTLELVVSDIWRQYPAQPSTFSKCAGEYCENASRGGHLCPVCLSKVLTELVGPGLGGEYAEAVRICVAARNAMYAVLTRDPESCTPGYVNSRNRSRGVRRPGVR